MIDISLIRDYSNIRFPLKYIQRIVRDVCLREKISSATLSFVFINDKKIRSINKKFLNHDFATDIITFPLETRGVNAEIYINVVQAKRQAKEYKTSLKNEMIRLVVHGTLHSIGYDDIIPAKKKVMFNRQERYVEKLSLLLKK